MPTIVPRLDRFLADERERLVEELVRLIRIPAICVESGPAIRQMAEAAAQLCESAGLVARIVETPGHPVVYAPGGPEEAHFTLLLYGHYDVFPVAGQAGWDNDPFEPVVTGDRVYARGAGDNKGQFLAHLSAIRWWEHHAGGLPIRAKVILEVEEEAGSRHLPGFVGRHKEELGVDLCVYSDGPMPPGDQSALLFGARGALVLEVDSTGPSRPLHSENFGVVVRNPAVELCRSPW